MNGSTEQASKIDVHLYHQILLWPLLIRKRGPADDFHNLGDDFLEELTNDLAPENAQSPWVWPDRPKANQTTTKIDLGDYYDTQQQHDYSEITYFHSFVRDFLYGDGKVSADRRPVRVLRRRDIRAMHVDVRDASKGKRTSVFAVLRIELYLFETGVALLVCEVKNEDSDLTLEQLLDLQNVIRMTFPRRWKDGVPSEAPLEVHFLSDGPNPKTLFTGDFTKHGPFVERVRTNAHLPVALHWQGLMEPLRLIETNDPKPSDRAGNFVYEPIVDQRIPSMTYVSVENPHAISRWDFARLVFYDGSGKSDLGSYSEEFLDTWEEQCAYDRFWLQAPPSGVSEADAQSQYRLRCIRWLISGYGFVAVGDTEKFFTTRLLANFQHHYFKMGLIVHFHRASLLMLRDELASTSNKLGRRPNPNDVELEAFKSAVSAVQQRMVRFRTRFWFREVSTQLQGQEIFALWSERMGNPELFQAITEDIDVASQVVRLAQEETENVEMSGLTRLATVAAFIAIVISLLALEDFHPERTFSTSNFWYWTSRIGVASLLSVGLLMLLAKVYKWLKPWIRKVI